MRRLTAHLLLVSAALVVAVSPSRASNIDLSSLLTNPSFESPSGTGCPTGWSCGGNQPPLVYVVTSSQYTAGADGLPSGIVPDGTQALYVPTGNQATGAGTLVQVTSSKWDTVNNTYTINIWIGTPKVAADGVTPIVGDPQTDRLTLLHSRP